MFSTAMAPIKRRLSRSKQLHSMNIIKKENLITYVHGFLYKDIWLSIPIAWCLQLLTRDAPRMDANLRRERICQALGLPRPIQPILPDLRGYALSGSPQVRDALYCIQVSRHFGSLRLESNLLNKDWRNTILRDNRANFRSSQWVSL